MDYFYENLHLIYDGQQNLLVLISAFIIAEVFKTTKLFSNYAGFIFPNNKRLQLLFTSLFAGILPIDGRISIAIPLFEGLACKHGDGQHAHVKHLPGNVSQLSARQKMGIISYLSTHHYYLWSPLEKSVVIILAGLHLSYMEFLSYTSPLLVTYLAFFTYFILRYVKEDDVTNVEVTERLCNSFKKTVVSLLPFIYGIVFSMMFHPWVVFPLIAAYYVISYKIPMKVAIVSVNWCLLFQVAFVIVISNFLSSQSLFIMTWLHDIDTKTDIVLLSVLPLAALSSFALGSSSKYAGITTALCSVFGSALFPLIFVLEYVGYFLSPTHKCTLIAHRTFKTPVLEFYRVLLLLSVTLLSVGLLEYSLFL
jgi:hypothetical protein